VPGLDLRHGDATALAFPDGAFDVVMESTMFAQLTDETLRRQVAAEMARVTKPGGLILLADWRYTRPSDKSERGLRRSAVRDMFAGVAVVEHVEHVEPAALAPPLGRRLSAKAPSLYFLVRRVAPFTVAQVVYVLRKSG
jgi:ubiquinone/menaquinone biosynthesis C-methylase UbiE